MKPKALRVVVALFVCALAAPAAAQPTGPKDRGFTLEIHLGSRLAALDFGIGGAYQISGLEGGFFAGYKLGRIMFGAGVEFARVATSQDNGNDTSDNRFLFMPGVRIALLRSADERVELYGQADLGIGHVWNDSNDEPFAITYQVGPGLRLWFHPNFAVGALVGLRGEFYVYDAGSTGVTSIFGHLALTGVF